LHRRQCRDPARGDRNNLGRGQGRDIGGYVDRYGWPTPFGHCIKMCAHDNLPCDPVYFKIGDGRCTSDAR
jgi:hypothetical protein